MGLLNLLFNRILMNVFPHLAKIMERVLMAWPASPVGVPVASMAVSVNTILMTALISSVQEPLECVRTLLKVISVCVFLDIQVCVSETLPTHV